MDNEKIAGELIKLAKELVTSEDNFQWQAYYRFEKDFLLQASNVVTEAYKPVIKAVNDAYTKAYAQYESGAADGLKKLIADSNMGHQVDVNKVVSSIRKPVGKPNFGLSYHSGSAVVEKSFKKVDREEIVKNHKNFI